MRFDNPGQKIMVGIQPNEDVNGRTFTYRFMEIAHDMWGDSWSVLSDPIAVSFPNLAAPKGSCFRSAPTKVTCDIKPNNNSEGTLIEFLNSEGKVVLSRDTKRWSSQRFTFDKVNKAYSVRLTSTSGDIPNWYRRGESINLPLTSKYNSNRFIFAVTP
jgi:hypothetical protein